MYQSSQIILSREVLSIYDVLLHYSKAKGKIRNNRYITFLFSALFIMNSPGFQRVTLIPMETTLYDSENAHTEKQPFWKRPNA